MVSMLSMPGLRKLLLTLWQQPCLTLHVTNHTQVKYSYAVPTLCVAPYTIIAAACRRFLRFCCYMVCCKSSCDAKRAQRNPYKLLFNKGTKVLKVRQQQQQQQRPAAAAAAAAAASCSTSSRQPQQEQVQQPAAAADSRSKSGSGQQQQEQLQ
jgi:hypothetical protein